MTYGCCFQPTSSSRSATGRHRKRRLAARTGGIWVERAAGVRGGCSGWTGQDWGSKVRVHAAISPAHSLPPWAGGWVVAESRIWLLSQDEQSRVLPCDSSPCCGSASPCLPSQTLHTPAAKNPSQLHKHPVRGVETQLQHGLGVLLVVLMLCHPASEIAAPLLKLLGLLPPVKTTAGIFPKILQA